MKNITLVKPLAMSLIFCGIVFAHPFCGAAQEGAPAQQEQPAGKMGMSGM